jgi:hypothetical protein
MVFITGKVTVGGAMDVITGPELMVGTIVVIDTDGIIAIVVMTEVDTGGETVGIEGGLETDGDGMAGGMLVDGVDPGIEDG